MAQETITGGTGVLWSTIKGLLNTNFTALWKLITLSGVAESAENLGTFTGSTIADSQTIKAALQTLETAVELRETITPSSLELTTDTSISEAQLLANRYITNQGASGEIDVTLPAVSYRITRTVVVEETQIIELNPPSGEAFDLAGTMLDADDCVDSPAVVGSKATVTRMKNAAGTWHWSIDIARGTWVDTGASN